MELGLFSKFYLMVCFAHMNLLRKWNDRLSDTHLETFELEQSFLAMYLFVWMG